MEISFILQFLAGAVLLYFSADFLLDGSKSVASKYKIPPIIIGITLVAFGTSLPELIVSIMANLKDKPGMVVGNVVGSNIANIALVLGAAAFLNPLFFQFRKIRTDLYFLLGVTLLPIIFIYCGELILWQGVFFLSLLAGYCWFLFRKDHTYEEEASVSLPALNTAGKIIFGIAGLGFGSNFFVDGASGIALAMGVSPLVIGMSLVALGTSLPELATSLVAAKKGEAGFAIGNVIGSNIINIVGVLGITLLIRPISTEFAQVSTQGCFMIILTLILFFLLKLKGGITKLPAGILLLIYIVFLYLNFQPV